MNFPGWAVHGSDPSSGWSRIRTLRFFQQVSLLAKRDSFLLRIDPAILTALRRWADDDLRSLNGQIEYVLRQSLQQAGRMCADQLDAPQETNSAAERKTK